MRKHLIATASLLALGLAGPALANDSTISQIGGTNTASVDQTGGNEGVSSIAQDGTGLSATVTQIDNPNTGSPGFTVASNTSTINQLGDSAEAIVEQTGDPGGDPGNESIITQFSDGNDPTLANVTQSGSNNLSTVEQGRDVDPLDRSGQTAVVTQDGTDHVSDILQRGNLNTANVDQASSGNTSTITQSGLDNEVGVTQTGSGNMSTVTQSANFGLATVDQSGDGNTSDVTQSGRANSSIAAVIDQSGNNNTSTILQTSLLPEAGSADQFAEVTQLTDGNTSTIEQDGGDPVVDAANPGNSASVFQTATAGNTSAITQSGAGNTATVNQ